MAQIQIINPVLIQLSESEKRFILAILLALILLILIVVGIGSVITKIFINQGKKIQNEVYDVVTLKIVKNKREFLSYAFRKNCQMFMKRIWIPLLLIAGGTITLIVHNAINNDFSYNPFDIEKGFLSLLWLWDFENPAYYNNFFGITLLSSWPELINTPHFVSEAWASYVFVPCVFIGAFCYLMCVQGFLARAFKIHKLKKNIYEKDLSNFKFDSSEDFENK